MMVENRNAYKVLGGKPVGKTPLERPTLGWRKILQRVLKKWDRRVWTQFIGSGYEQVVDSCEHDNEPRFHKMLGIYRLAEQLSASH
jgi:hypothetical protein